MAERPFPSNTDKSRQEASQEVTPVTKATFVEQSGAKKVFHSIIKADGQAVKNYVLTDGISNLFETILGGIKSAFDIFIYGEVRTPQNKGFGSSKPKIIYTDDSRRPYASYYNSPQNRPSTMFDVDYAFVEDTEQAKLIISLLGDIIEQYGCVSVSRFYEMLGRTGDTACEAWGWTSVQGFRAMPCTPSDENGWNSGKIISPPAHPLPKRGSINR